MQQAKALTLHDQGKGLLDKLSEYGGLAGALEGLKDEVHSLGKQAEDMEEKDDLKRQLEEDVAKLRAEKAALEPCVKQLVEEKSELARTRARVEALQKKEDALEADLREREARRDLLTGEVGRLEQKAFDLQEVGKQAETAAARLAKITSEMEAAGNKWEIFEGLLGFVGSRSRSDLATFVGSLPGLVEEAKKGTYSPDALKRAVLDGLTGGMLKSLVCGSCGAKFDVDKPPQTFSGYECLACHVSHFVKVDRDALKILGSALAPPQRMTALKGQPYPKLANPPVVSWTQPSGEPGS